MALGAHYRQADKDDTPDVESETMAETMQWLKTQEWGTSINKARLWGRFQYTHIGLSDNRGTLFGDPYNKDPTI